MAAVHLVRPLLEYENVVSVKPGTGSGNHSVHGHLYHMKKHEGVVGFGVMRHRVFCDIMNEITDNNLTLSYLNILHFTDRQDNPWAASVDYIFFKKEADVVLFNMHLLGYVAEGRHSQPGIREHNPFVKII